MSLQLPCLPELVSVRVQDPNKSAESSCFRRLDVREHLTLLPCYVGNLSEGIVEHLNAKILRYSSLLDGVLLSYSRPRVMQKEGKIHDEQPHIHFDLSYSAYIFRPTLGSVLCGTVNKVGTDHIGCLLYDCFNVTVVSKSEKTENGLCSNFPSGFENGSDICFRVMSLDSVGNFLSLTGEYCDLGEVSSCKHKEKKRKQNSVTGKETLTGSKAKKRKKKS